MADITTGSDLRSGTIDELARTVSTEDQLALIRAVETSFESLFTWDYGKGQRQALNKLYEKAKTSQWNAETDIDWSITGQIEGPGTPPTRSTPWAPRTRVPSASSTRKSGPSSATPAWRGR
jgi:hypothetical protein